MEELSWTTDRVAELRKFAAMNWSCKQIAGALGGISRNAVIGKLHRLGITNARTLGPRPAGNHGHIRERRSGNNVRVRPLRPRKAAPLRVPQLPIIDLPDECIPLHQRKTIFELDNQTCRWPCGTPGTPEFFYCGSIEANNAAGIPYCRAHTLRACAKTVALSIAPRRAAA